MQKADKLTIMDDSSSQIIFTINANDQVVSYERIYAGSVQIAWKNVVIFKKRLNSLLADNFIEATVQSVKLSFLSIASAERFSIYSPAWYIENTSS